MDNKRVAEICKVGRGNDCCRYLVCDAEGWQCAKHTELKGILDLRVLAGDMNARGDNCKGREYGA